MVDRSENVSRCIVALKDGDLEAVNRMLPHVYDDLRVLARRIVGKNAAAMTLQPTALVHEAYARLVKTPYRNYESKGHFMRVAAIAMRQLLSSYARAQRAEKRGGTQEQEAIHSGIATDLTSSPIDLVVLDEAMTEFSAKFPRQARVVELRFFTGLSVTETADALGVSERTAKSDWQMARAWLSRALASFGDDEPEVDKKNS